MNIGIIGYNEGNGHPYSFSAIINGYNEINMKASRYPVIYNYLQKRDKTEFGINDFKVTHIWTPFADISEEIAQCTYIDNVVLDYKDMYGSVDAVIIARDDVESHFEIAKFFLELGIYVLVDKPLSICKGQIDFYMPYLQSAQLMSCSGLRYANEIVSRFGGELRNEKLCFVNAITVLDWCKYGIHVLEGVTPILGSDIAQVERITTGDNDVLVKVSYTSGKYLLIQLNKKMLNGINAHFYMEDMVLTVNFNDNFSYFKSMLLEFSKMIKTGNPAINPEETKAILYAIIEGNK